MSQCAQFLLQFNKFVQENYLEEEGLLMGVYKFYIPLRNDYKFKEKIMKALEDAGKHGLNLNFLHILQFLAYLIEIDPGIIKDKRREALFKHGMSYFKSVNSDEDAEFLTIALGKLISTQIFADLINKITSFTDSNSENLKEAQKFLMLMEQKIRWEIEKKKLLLVVREGASIIKQFLSGFNEFFYKRPPLLQEGKMRILKNFLSYHLHHIDYLDGQNVLSLNHHSDGKQKGKIIEQVHFFIQNSQNINLKLELVTLCLKLFGIYDISSLAKVVKDYIYLTSNKSYLEVINIILDISQSAMVITKDMSRNILRNIDDNILQVEGGNPSENYEIVRDMCDLMINISKIYVIDFTKQITKKFSQLAIKDYHQIFLSSLLLIYDLKMPEYFITSITDWQKTRYIRNKYEEDYYTFLKSFGLEDRGISGLRLDPERINQQIPWELQALRISTLVNFEWIYEGHLFKGILLNLIRYVLLNIYPNQSTEIAIKIIRSMTRASLIKEVNQSDNQYRRNELNDINLSEVVQLVNQACINNTVDFPSTDSLSNLLKILKSLKKNSQIYCLSNFSLFLQVTRLIGIIITLGKRTDKKFTWLSIELMRASLPQEKVQADEINLNSILEYLSYFIRQQPNKNYLQIYIEVVFICLKKQAFLQMITNHELFHFIEPFHFMEPFHFTERKNISNFEESQRRKLEITHYMLKNDSLDRGMVANCWKYFNEAIFRDDPEVCLFVGKIFCHFVNQMNLTDRSAQMKECMAFKREQIECTLDSLSSISNKLKGTVITKEAINYLQVLKAFEIYLFSSVNNYKKLNEPTEELFQRVKNVSIQLLSSLNEKKWTQNLKRKDQQGVIFRDTWEIAYTIQLLLVETSLRSTSFQNNLNKRQDKKIVEKYLYSQKKLGKRKYKNVRNFQLKAMLMSKAVPSAKITDVSSRK